MMMDATNMVRSVAPGIQLRSATGTLMALRKAACFALVLLVLAGCARGGAPVVGISAGWDRGRIDVSDAYAAAVSAAGGVPVVLPPVLTADDAAEVLSHVDALVLTGGEDVDPARYGEEVWNETVEVNYRRDTSDFLLARAALDAGLPILGICRGEQLMNVLLGGSLYQDLPTQYTTQKTSVNGTAAAICHRQSEPDGVGTHMIYIEAGSHLHDLLGADSLMVNTFHHQAVKDPGAGVRVVARAADGVVEAWECDGVGPDAKTGRSVKCSIVCVQFHPELLYARGGNTAFLPIFEDLIHRAASN